MGWDNNKSKNISPQRTQKTRIKKQGSAPVFPALYPHSNFSFYQQGMTACHPLLLPADNHLFYTKKNPNISVRVFRY